MSHAVLVLKFCLCVLLEFVSMAVDIIFFVLWFSLIPCNDLFLFCL